MLLAAAAAALQCCRGLCLQGAISSAVLHRQELRLTHLQCWHAETGQTQHQVLLQSDLSACLSSASLCQEG